MKIQVIVGLAAAVIAVAQTRVDLSTQAKKVDFALSESTRSFKTGSTLPVSCVQGETFFLLTPPAGFYGCTVTNTWTAQGGAQAGPAVTVTRVTPTQLTVVLGQFRFGNSTTALATGGIQLSGSANGALWGYATDTGNVVFAHNLGAGNVVVSGAGFLLNNSGAGYPSDALPLFDCVVQGGAVPSDCSIRQTSIGRDVVKSGPSGAVAVDCSLGRNCDIDIVPALVPTKNGANDFTGSNTFRQLGIPAGSAVVATECNEPGEAGRIFLVTSTVDLPQLHVCSGTAGWKAASAGPDSSVLQSDEFFTSAGWSLQGAGTGNSQGILPGELSHPGLLRLVSGSTLTSDYAAAGLTGASLTDAMGGTPANWELRFLLRPGTAIGSIVRAGWVSTTATHTPAQSISARYDHGTDATNGVWVFEVCSTSGCSTALSTIPVSAATWYRVLISRSSSGVISFAINDESPVCITSTASGCATNNATMPSLPLSPAILVGSSGTASSRTVDVDRYSIELRGIGPRY